MYTHNVYIIYTAYQMVISTKEKYGIWRRAKKTGAKS